MENKDQRMEEPVKNVVPTADKELPDWIESRIESPNYDRDLTQRAVAVEFEYGDRPFYNVAAMHAAVGGEVSTDTVQSRMDELVERGVLKHEKINNGGIYWLNREESAWPIPSDVDVEPKRTEPTVSEWKKYDYVQLAALSIVIAILGTAVTLVGTFQAGGFYSTPLLASEIIGIGLSAGLTSYLGLLGAGLLWIFDLPNSLDLRLMS